ncbi:hypothetical protein C4256_02115 [Clostridioides difficile]|uniref:hypothetical protein n=1 Tax=Clostridioides difficile TaxID=1496 RepID=UPI001A1BE90C|nr:hypothetical protein [Clostridioides difficile]MDB3638992.1 hypothetical protein [Clostridioides difficile]MDV9723610.1 hypothetical protein [Clostridioides difficile]HBF1330980.1 hypothetical protein [Clostridioides difficile]HBF3532401.1 hypothetical protein [Clostridioides difficile]
MILKNDYININVHIGGLYLIYDNNFYGAIGIIEDILDNSIMIKIKGFGVYNSIISEIDYIEMI